MKTIFRPRLIASLVLGLGISLVAQSAYAAVLNYSADTTIALSSPAINLTILSGSVATSLVVNTGSINVVVPASGVFTVTSASRSLSVSGLSTDSVGTTSCSGDFLYTLTITAPSTGAETIVITPNETKCIPGGGSGGGGSGSGGGGGGVIPPVIPPVVVPPVVAHGPGSVVKTSEGTVWFITNSNPVQRRAFTSGGAFLSYGFLSFSQVVDANSADLALTTGSFIAPRDGSVFCATVTKDTDVKGECALITNSQKAAFTSAAVFTGLGFKFSNAQYGDSSFLAKTANIATVSEAHRTGVLVNNAGTIQLVGNATLVGIPSMDIFSSWGYTLAGVVPANQFDKLLPQSGVMIGRVAGQLNPVQ